MIFWWKNCKYQGFSYDFLCFPYYSCTKEIIGKSMGKSLIFARFSSESHLEVIFLSDFFLATMDSSSRPRDRQNGRGTSSLDLASVWIFCQEISQKPFRNIGKYSFYFKKCCELSSTVCSPHTATVPVFILGVQIWGRTPPPTIKSTSTECVVPILTVVIVHHSPDLIPER